MPLFLAFSMLLKNLSLGCHSFVFILSFLTENSKRFSLLIFKIFNISRYLLFILLRVCDTFLNEGLIFVQFTKMFRFYPFKYCFSTINTLAYFLYSSNRCMCWRHSIYSPCPLSVFSVASPWDSSLRLISWPLRVLTDQLASRWDQTPLLQLGPFCPWSPPGMDNWSEYPEQAKNKRHYWPLSPSFSLSSS